MDVMSPNKSNDVHRKKHKRINTKIKHFSIEIYFMWFSALIFLAETFVGKYTITIIQIKQSCRTFSNYSSEIADNLEASSPIIRSYVYSMLFV